LAGALILTGQVSVRAKTHFGRSTRTDRSGLGQDTNTSTRQFGCGSVYFGQQFVKKLRKRERRKRRECGCTTYLYQGVTRVNFMYYFEDC
jgi:hypothetical protein